jgi:hypothetical protein
MEIKRAFYDGGIVIFHCHWVRGPGELGNPVVDFLGWKMARL